MMRSSFRTKTWEERKATKLRRETLAREKLALQHKIAGLNPEEKRWERLRGWPTWLPKRAWRDLGWDALREEDWDSFLDDAANKVGHCNASWHCNVTTGSLEGWFDRIWFYNRTFVPAELKARGISGRANKPSAAQWVFINAAIASGWPVKVWLLPDDLPEAWTTLTGKPWDECPYAQELNHWKETHDVRTHPAT